MELILAVVVVIAVIIFGALISVGNERQRRAIDHLREQVVLWAIQDLRLKREKLAREVRVDDPLAWLNKLTNKITGYDVQLRNKVVFDSPTAVACDASDGSGKVVFTPLAPQDIRRLTKHRKSRLDQYAQEHPLFALRRNTMAYEISMLNAGTLFDLELPLVWSSLTGQEVEQASIWLYWMV